MCGHVGIAGRLVTKDEAVMKRLLLFDYFRGPDSTGAAAVGRNGQTKIVKIASSPLTLFETKAYDTVMNAFQSKVFIGHNRAATRGVVNWSNTHPYEYGNLVAAHNGTLDYQSAKTLEEVLEQKFDVDSQGLICGMAKLGVEETISDMKGAWSLVWYNSEDNTLNFLRNKERPMWFAWTEEGDKLYWASEWETIDCALRMAQNYPKLHKDDKGFTFFSTEEDKWYSFNMADFEKQGERPKPKVKEVKGKEATPAATTPFKHTDHRGGGNTDARRGTTKTSTTSVAKRDASDEPMQINLQGDQSDPLCGYYTEDEFACLNASKHGCDFCGEPVKYDDKGLTIFERDELVLCPTCSGSGYQPTRIIAESFRHLSLLN